ERLTMRDCLFASLLAWAAAGCYYYQPLATPDPTPGTYLSATITDTGADHLARAIGPDVLSVRGRGVRCDSGGLTLAVTGGSLRHQPDLPRHAEHPQRQHELGARRRGHGPDARALAVVRHRDRHIEPMMIGDVQRDFGGWRGCDSGGAGDAVMGAGRRAYHAKPQHCRDDTPAGQG